MIHARKDYNDIQEVDKRIPDDEPVFLLRAQDELAAYTIQFYIVARKIKYGEDDEIAQLLRDFLPKVKAWHKKKKADL